uniref:Uncharacterized protein n=1 Tax=Setaria viridis TaxID=4556 RepID=A0A4U6SVN5_SETVI|nr:hypothetical protein SEVIR_9G087600v2 [Setaria viridis]
MSLPLVPDSRWSSRQSHARAPPAAAHARVPAFQNRPYQLSHWVRPQLFPLARSLAWIGLAGSRLRFNRGLWSWSAGHSDVRESSAFLRYGSAAFQSLRLPRRRFPFHKSSCAPTVAHAVAASSTQAETLSPSLHRPSKKPTILSVFFPSPKQSYSI